MPADPQGAGRHGAYSAVVAFRRIDPVDHGMAGQEGGKVFADPDRAHARTTAAVRDTEGLVEIDVGDIGTYLARTADAE